MVIYAGTEGYLDNVPVNKVREWEKGFLQFVREQRSEVRNLLLKQQKLSDEVLTGLKKALEDYNSDFMEGLKKAAGELVGAGK